MNESADSVGRVVAFLVGASIPIVLWVFTYLNLRDAERRNRRLAMIEKTFEDLADWEKRFIRFAIVTEQRVRSMSSLDERMKDLQAAQDPGRLAARLDLFGFFETADKLHELHKFSAEVYPLLNSSGISELERAELEAAQERVGSALEDVECALKKLHREVENSGWLARFRDWADGIK